MNITKGLILLLLLITLTKVSAQITDPTSAIYQLREYKLQSQHKDVFVSNFKNHTMPIMRKYGFNILSTWTNNNEFHYLLKWDNENAMQNQWAQFKSDKEWLRQKEIIQQKYGDIVEEITEQTLSDMYLSNNSKSVENGFIKLNIGDVECIALSDGSVSLPVQPSMAPNIATEIVSDALKSNFRNDSIIDYPINILLLKKDSRLILIDAGQGALTNKNAGKLIGYLQTLGIQPSQITDIIISHAHTDHIDGLIDMNGNSIYENADIYISRVEFEFWQGMDNDFAKSVNGVLSGVKPQLRFFEDGAIIHDCIKNNIVAGHTPGHVVCTIFSGEESLVAINDLVLDALVLTNPDWGSGFDADFEGAKGIRKNCLLQLYNSKTLIWGSHLPYPGIGHLKKIGEDSYEWSPKFLSYPSINP